MKPVESAIIVIFGITGDLSRRKLLPALYHLVKDGLLSEKTRILGVTRQDIDPKELLNDVTLCSHEKDNICDPGAVRQLRDKISLVQMDLDDTQAYEQLKRTMADIENVSGETMQRLFYLSVPPQATASIVRQLGAVDLAHQGRLLIEKPFGHNLASSESLVAEMSAIFAESQIYRIDHYVAKETVQNILTFRFNNPMFADIWSSEHIAKIEIVAYEKIGIEGRAVFYEHMGALRDFVQSHLLQLLALVIMDRPQEFSSDAVHESKLQALHSLMVPSADDVARNATRGQYDAYKTEVDNVDSFVETYAAIRVFASSERWQGVPMILRTGKGLAEKRTEIVVTFKPKHNTAHENQLIFRIQPDEGITIHVNVKRPGLAYQDEVAAMDFSYERAFDDHGHPDAYERVLIDALKGDHTLFATSEEVLAAWKVVDPIMHAWEASDGGLQVYHSGGDAPADAWQG